MLAFYGLEWSLTGISIEKSSTEFDERSKNWLVDGNHNLKRLTRVLNSLVTIGLWEEALAFYQCLEKVSKDKINSTTRSIWYKTLTENKNATIEERAAIRSAIINKAPTLKIKSQSATARPSSLSSHKDHKAHKDHKKTQSQQKWSVEEKIASKIQDKINLNYLPLIEKGMIDNTCKVAFKNDKDAKAFINHLKKIYKDEELIKSSEENNSNLQSAFFNSLRSIFGIKTYEKSYDLSYYGDNEKYSMQKDDETYKYIVRFERPIGAHFSLLMVDYFENELELPEEIRQQFVSAFEKQSSKSPKSFS